MWPVQCADHGEWGSFLAGRLPLREPGRSRLALGRTSGHVGGLLLVEQPWGTHPGGPRFAGWGALPGVCPRALALPGHAREHLACCLAQ